MYLEKSKCVSNRFISFYGGEPLINFSLIKRCIQYVKEVPGTQDINFSMTSNGLLVRKNIAQFLRAFFTDIDNQYQSYNKTYS